MSQVQFIGLDIAKNVFHIHGADHTGRPVVRRQLRRAELLRYVCDGAPLGA